MAKLSEEDKVVIRSMQNKDISNRRLASLFGVDEGAIRYHRKRENKPDGRKNKQQKAEALSTVIDAWLETNKPETGRRPNAFELWSYLADVYGYTGSHKSIVRYLNKHLPPEKMRPRRRVETPPGIQAQADWGEFFVSVGGRPRDLYAFILTLAFSRAVAVAWSERMSMLNWLTCHNKAFLFLEGIPYVVRIDNLKTGVQSGAGPAAVINPVYSAYASELRFVIDPVRAATPTDKGKVEAKVKLLRYGINPEGKNFSSMEELVLWTNAQLLRRFSLMKNPLTGTSIKEAWDVERSLLKPLPSVLPEVFDSVVAREVGDDCLVSFEGRRYSVPFAFMRRRVEVRGGAYAVNIFSDGRLIATHPRGTRKRLLIDQRHYEGSPSHTVARPAPLGKLTKEILRLWDIPVEKRNIDLYDRLLEVRHGL